MNLTTTRIATIATVIVAVVIHPQGALIDLAVIGGVVVFIDTAKPLKRWFDGLFGGKRGGDAALKAA